jgi:predicted alpha/beta hydrolase
MFVGFAIGLALGVTGARNSYVIGAVVVLGLVAFSYVVSFGVLPLYALSDTQMAVVFLATIASPFVGVWLGNVARRLLANPRSNR